jgi:hypothetical protein
LSANYGRIVPPVLCFSLHHLKRKNFVSKDQPRVTGSPKSTIQIDVENFDEIAEWYQRHRKHGPIREGARYTLCETCSEKLEIFEVVLAQARRRYHILQKLLDRHYGKVN